MYRWIGLCGALGAVCRYALSCWVSAHPFPLSTLIVNVIGCFALAYISHFPRVPQTIKTAVGTGFIGAFTTFSTFSKDNAALLFEHSYILLGANITISLVGGLLAAAAGVQCALALGTHTQEGK